MVFLGNGVLQNQSDLFFVFVFAPAAASASAGIFCGAASAAVGAADAFFAAFLRFVNIEDGGAENQCQYGDDDYICHEMISTPLLQFPFIYFFAPRAYSSLRPLFVFMQT